jgi:peptidoglycan/xylan/chitin deacetylase (PgdA/CDA1 family)
MKPSCHALFKYILLSLCVYSTAIAALPPVTPVFPDTPPAIVLKVDDLSADKGGIPAAWKRLTDFALERKLKISIGVITQSLATAKPAYLDYIKGLRETGLVEFWFHGYDHKRWTENGHELQEFKGTPYEQQKDHFVKSQALAKEKLGFAFTAFGSPFNGYDDATLRVLAEDADIQAFLYGRPSAQSRLPGKVVLERVGDVNIEAPLFEPNPEAFIAGYLKNAATHRYFVIQGHPGQWNDARWAEFVKLVDYLQQNHIPVVTIAELAASLSAPES